MKRAKKIIDNVYWVGVRDLNNRHFHGDLYPSMKAVHTMHI